MSQLFERGSMLTRIISFCLVLMMVVAMIPASAPEAAALSGGDKIYLKPNSNWNQASARFAAYFFGNGETWVSMTAEGDGVYSCTIPNGYSQVIFCRMNPNASANNWDNKWDQTEDLTVPTDDTNCYTVKEGTWSKGGGDWSTYAIACSHPSHGQDGKCTSCGEIVSHSYSNGSCTVCGAADPNFEPTYYLVGYINGADYGIGTDNENLGEYKFVNGTLTATFTARTDVMIKTDNNQWFMTKAYVQTTSGIFYNCADNEDAQEKMSVPFGVEVTFTLTKNDDGTLTLSYTTGTCLHPSHNTNGNCTSCGEYVGHSFSDATCTAPKTCSVCGATEGTTLDHSWSDATCTAPKTCSVCGATEGDALGHNYVNGTCSRCGAADPDAATVKVCYLAGSMNNWSTTSTPLMGKNSTTGSVTIDLTAGTYTFKIVYDDVWYGNGGTIEDTTTATSSTGWVMDSNSGDCTLKASGGSYTFTFNTSTKALVVTHNSSGDSDDVKLYVGTTFYDYRSDHELGGGKLSDRNWFDLTNSGWDCWYIFRNFNSKLSGYYSNNKVKVPIYMGHFQPSWGDYGITYREFANKYNENGNYIGKLYGFEDNKAAGNNDGDQKWFMSVNNSLMSTGDPIFGDSNIDKASWGIVAPALEGINKQLMVSTTSGTVAHPLFNENFLNQKVNNRTLANIYHDVQFPFTKVDPDNNGIEYWVFNSENTTLKMAENDEGYYLSEVSNPGDGFKNRKSDGNIADNGKFGFFPFNTGSESYANQYNYGFGMRLDIPFNLTSDGKLADKYGDKQDIIFKFSGDDDVWVFIDGVLVLDIGGSHGKVTGEINFGNMTATVSDVKASLGNTNPADADNNHANGYQTKFTLPKEMAGEHTLTMFYMERGMWESNMSISFNFIPDSSLWAKETSFTVQKQWNVSEDSAIPASVTVQLQRRLQGTTNWSAVENKTLTAANVSSQRVANTWEYTWENLPNFADETLYEYRVVELGENNAVLSNGESYLGKMVAYGDVAGNGAQGYTQIISNNQVPNPVVVVIDFGLSVDVNVVGAAGATLQGVGNTLKLPVGNSTTLDSNVVETVEGKHGVATKVGNKIRYTPNDMMMDSADNIGFCVNLGNGQYNYSTLTVIPAANIYYEDNFLNFKNASNATSSYGKWSIDVTTSDKIQAEDRPGALNAYDANNVYGYDQAYDNFTLYSLGSARQVTVDAATGKPTTAPTATFSFIGTGFDVVSLTDSDSGCIVVEVRQNGSIVENYVVNNYYGLVFNENTGTWEHATDTSDYHLYQVPVIKVADLDYGTYDVTIKAAYLKSMDKTGNDGAYTIWLDAIRIYNPAQNDKTSNDAYEQDGEMNPHLTTVKKLLVIPGFDAYDESNSKERINGVVFVEGKDDVVSMAEYANQGPNNETYLKNGNSVVFKFLIKDVVDSSIGPQVSLQIGAKLAVGEEATLKVAFNGSTEATTDVTLTTATNMFYKLPDISWKQVEGGWVSCPILFECEADNGNILSLTDLKLTGPDADFAAYVPADGNVAEANILTFVDNECYTYAVNMMSASEVPSEPETSEPETSEPETSEPETTEPETTEPEVTEPETTEPETSEPETSEPETTEPETTEPATTAPEKDPSNAQTGDDFGQNLPVFAAAAFLSLLAVLFMAAYATRREDRT